MIPAHIVADLPDLEEEEIRKARGHGAAVAQDEIQTLRA
jgi:hypothetical protein